MTMTMHLGVTDILYNTPPKVVKKGGRHGLRNPPVISTGDVAEILEDKYHVMRVFSEVHKPFIAKALEKGLAGALESLLSGAPASLDPFAEGLSAIEDRFKQFLARKEMDRLGYPGVPTQASLDGVNHRFLHPYAKANKSRPSFIDTGQYVASFKAWFDA